MNHAHFSLLWTHTYIQTSAILNMWVIYCPCNGPLFPQCRDFEGNELTEIVSGAFAGSLRSVSLPNNRIATIEPGAFTGVQETATIDLQNNNLSSIPEGVFTAQYRSL